VCLIGAFTIAGKMFDVYLALGFGVVGYVFKKLDYPIAPLILAMVLGDKTEDAFRQSMLLSHGSLGIFYGNGLVGTLVTAALLLALRSRTIPAPDAVAQSLAALEWLRAAGATRFYFKYCSTFDSTAQGNIGPVADALMRALDTDFTVVCPAFPENGRTVYAG